MAQNVTEVFRVTVPSVGLVLKARADIGGKQEAYCARIREDVEKGADAIVETAYSANVVPSTLRVAMKRRDMLTKVH